MQERRGMDVWQSDMEKDVGDLKTSVGKLEVVVETVGTQHTEALKSLGRQIESQSAKQPLMPQIVALVAVIGLMGAGVAMYVSPIKDEQTAFKQQWFEQNKLQLEQQYKLGKLEASVQVGG